jgi:hypothetical protein
MNSRFSGRILVFLVWILMGGVVLAENFGKCMPTFPFWQTSTIICNVSGYTWYESPLWSCFGSVLVIPAQGKCDGGDEEICPQWDVPLMVT